jgi:ABC-type polysaccharide/polyol phosphate transport system ATPase subunit
MNRLSPSVCEKDWAIEAKNLAKVFPLQNGYDTAFRALTGRLFGRSRHSRSLFALKDINLEISRGEKIAIVGNNGAGKTTLLRVIAGLSAPTSGTIRVNGEMLLLRGLEIGLVDDLSAAENLFLYGAIYGLDREKIKAKSQEIFEWAELEAFTRAKLGTLSSGMKARLAFSAIRHLEADIFLLDEAFSAADINFKKKYEEVFQSQRNSDKTFLIATHDLSFAKTFCEKSLWLNKGTQMAFDKTAKVLNLYTRARSA